MPAREALDGLKQRLGARGVWARLAFICLIGFVVSSPFSISAAQLFGFAGAGLWLISLNSEGAVFRNRLPLRGPWAAFALLTLASALAAESPWQSLWDARKLAQILLFYFAINTVRDEWEARWLVKTLFAAAGLACAWTLARALPGPVDLAHRMSGFFSIYMTLGGYLLVAGSIALAYLFVPGGAGRERWAYAAAALMGGALVGTFSRNAWVGMAVSVLVIALAGRSWRALAVAVAAAAAVWVAAPEAVRGRVFSLGDPRDPTRVERLLMWQSGLRMALDRPLLGVGPGRVKKAFPAYADPRAKKQRTGHLHNSFLHLAAERGLPAAAAWLWAWLAYFWLAGRRLGGRKEPPPAGRWRTVAGLAAAAGFFTAGMFEYNFGDSEAVMLAFFALALPFMAEPKAD
ncbi:MAG: O-antigen ligase family protein [Nitrospinota bacterium]